jgi:hypothetical protein
MYGDPSLGAVIADGDLERPPAFVPRVLDLLTVHDPDVAATYLKRHHLTLETFAVAPGTLRADIETAALAAGARRITQLGAMQLPLLRLPHDGRPRIAEFVKFIAYG